MPNAALGSELEIRHAAGLYRERLIRDDGAGVGVTRAGKPMVNFCSNDYLGLSHHSRVVQALESGARKWGVGAGASHLVTGHTAAHEALEEELADFVGAERALLFSTGYMANLGVVSALVSRGDTVIGDRLNHASLIDAALLSRARLRRYPHADAAAAERLLAGATGQKLLATDGVFSMDGDLAPVPALLDSCSRHDSWLLVDDAHGFGVLGANGRGILEHFSLWPRAPGPRPLIYMATLGKAAGVFGAFVAGDRDLIETLVQSARTYIYTTAPPPALAEATRAALRVIREEPWRHEKLHDHIRYFRAATRQLDLPLAESSTAIQPIILGDDGRAMAASRLLCERGLWVTAIRPPTVPAGTSRLRITLSAAHEREHIDRLLDALAVACKRSA